MLRITPAPLTKAAFAPFGDVVELEGCAPLAINQGFAERFHNLGHVDVASEGGTACVSLFVAQPRPRPIVIKLMERHPLGSQIFYPLQDSAWAVVVCTDPHDAASYRAFAATGAQGVNYARGVWHHPLLVLAAASRFMVVDRQGPSNNLDEVWLPAHQRLALTI